MKLTTFFNSKTKAIYLNLVIAYESILKINLTLPRGHFSKLYLRQQLFTNKDFCRKTRLCNYFIITNAMALTKAVLGNPYRVLPRMLRTTTLKRPVHFYRPFNL